MTMFFIFWTKTGKTLEKTKIGINLVNFSIFGNLCQIFVIGHKIETKTLVPQHIDMKIVWIFSHIFM